MGKARGIQKKVPKKRKVPKVKKKERVTRMGYPRENVILALKEVNNGKSIASVSKKYNIPESTIRAKKCNKYADKKPGPAAVLNSTEENEIADWLLESATHGFPITKPQLLDTVQTICINLKKQTPFTDNKPGRAWYNGFLKRHPEICGTISENISLSRAKVTEEALISWFKETKRRLINNNLLSIEPERIFHCDKTGIVLNQKPSAPVTSKGSRSKTNSVENNEKENITVLITGNAAGHLLPTLILFTGKSLPKNTTDFAPSEFSFGCNENGRLDSQNFFAFISNKFEPWLTEKQIKRPVILFIDGHSSHLTLQLSKFCSQHQIVLIALHPNAAHILHPLEISFFKTLKTAWQKTYKKICSEFSTIDIKNYQFTPNLKKALDSMEIENLLKNGFEKCGLYPFDINAVDLSKVLIKNLPVCDILMSEDTAVPEDQVNTLHAIESLLTQEQKQAFRINGGPTWRGAEADTSLYNVWYKLMHPNDIFLVNKFEDHFIAFS